MNWRSRSQWIGWLILGFAVLCVGMYCLWREADEGSANTLIIGLLVGGATIVISLMHYWLERDKEFRALFKDMNSAYDQLNNQLDAVEAGRLTGPEAQKAVVDYMNLCAEEYFWLKRGRIDGDVWQAWESGMRSRFKHEKIAELARPELKEYSASYYGWERLAEKMLPKPTETKKT